MSLINTCHLLLTNLHRCLEEAVKGVYGFVPMPAAGTLADRAVSLKATFDANPSAFVTTLAHLTTLNSLLAEYRQQAFPANTTTITVEATRLIAWNDVINKPVKFPPTAHTHTAQPIAWDAVQNKPTTFPPDVHAHDYASITNKPATFPPDVHAHDYASITNKPATFPPDVHAHDYASITGKPATFPPADHAHDLLQIGGLLLRYNSAEGYLEQSANAGATWTPLVSESAPPSATAYALSWATITDNGVKISRSLPGAWINGNIQIWLRLSIDAATWGSYLLNAYQFYCSVGYDGAFGVHYFNNDGDEQSIYDARIGLTGWHDIGIQWTEASNSCIIYIDGVGGTAFYARKATVDTAGSYTLEIGAPKSQLAALVWGNALTWSAATAAKDTITPVTMSLPLSEGSGATATDSTGAAWTIPAGVTWEGL